MIQMNIDVNVKDIRVQGRRREILRPVKVRLHTALCHLVTIVSITTEMYSITVLIQIMENEGEFLALKLVRDRYAYSMEATCPKGG